MHIGECGSRVCRGEDVLVFSVIVNSWNTFAENDCVDKGEWIPVTTSWIQDPILVASTFWIECQPNFTARIHHMTIPCKCHLKLPAE